MSAKIQMTEQQWFAHLQAHKAQRTVPASKVERVQQAMHWWNNLPEVDRKAQGSGLRTATDIRDYYWADEVPHESGI